MRRSNRMKRILISWVLGQIERLHYVPEILVAPLPCATPHRRLQTATARPRPAPRCRSAPASSPACIDPTRKELEHP